MSLNNSFTAPPRPAGKIIINNFYAYSDMGAPIISAQPSINSQSTYLEEPEV